MTTHYNVQEISVCISTNVIIVTSRNSVLNTKNCVEWICILIVPSSHK